VTKFDRLQKPFRNWKSRNFSVLGFDWPCKQKRHPKKRYYLLFIQALKRRISAVMGKEKGAGEGGRGREPGRMGGGRRERIRWEAGQKRAGRGVLRRRESFVKC